MISRQSQVEDPRALTTVNSLIRVSRSYSAVMLRVTWIRITDHMAPCRLRSNTTFQENSEILRFHNHKHLWRLFQKKIVYDSKTVYYANSKRSLTSVNDQVRHGEIRSVIRVHVTRQKMVVYVAYLPVYGRKQSWTNFVTFDLGCSTSCFFYQAREKVEKGTCLRQNQNAKLWTS